MRKLSLRLIALTALFAIGLSGIENVHAQQSRQIKVSHEVVGSTPEVSESVARRLGISSKQENLVAAPIPQFDSAPMPRFEQEAVEPGPLDKFAGTQVEPVQYVPQEQLPPSQFAYRGQNIYPKTPQYDEADYIHEQARIERQTFDASQCNFDRQCRQDASQCYDEWRGFCRQRDLDWECDCDPFPRNEKRICGNGSDAGFGSGLGTGKCGTGNCSHGCGRARLNAVAGTVRNTVSRIGACASQLRPKCRCSRVPQNCGCQSGADCTCHNGCNCGTTSSCGCQTETTSPPACQCNAKGCSTAPKNQQQAAALLKGQMFK